MWRVTFEKSQLLGGNIKFIPQKTYPYYSIKHSLSNLISTPVFVEQCEKWRKRVLDVPPGIMDDVCDGRIWKQF